MSSTYLTPLANRIAANESCSNICFVIMKTCDLVNFYQFPTRTFPLLYLSSLHLMLRRLKNMRLVIKLSRFALLWSAPQNLWYQLMRSDILFGERKCTLFVMQKRLLKSVKWKCDCYKYVHSLRHVQNFLIETHVPFSNISVFNTATSFELNFIIRFLIFPAFSLLFLWHICKFWYFLSLDLRFKSQILISVGDFWLIHYESSKKVMGMKIKKMIE